MKMLQEIGALTHNPTLLTLGAVTTASLLLYGIRKNAAGGACTHVVDLTGKNVIITGGNAGVGLETARALAKMGASVWIAGRNKQLCEEAVNELKKDTKNNNIDHLQLDLAELESVRKCADEIKRRDIPIHILVNNAGVIVDYYAQTKDGFEIQFGTNYLGPFLLTNLLFDNLAQNNARVVNVSSLAQYYGNIDFNTFRTGGAKGHDGYTQSKLALLLFTNELQRKFQEKGSKATANSLHPGIFFSKLSSRTYSIPVKTYIFHGLTYIFGKTVVEGAQTSIYCCVAPELEGIGGKYFSDCKESATVNPAALDVELAKKLWSVSEDLAGLSKKKINAFTETS